MNALFFLVLPLVLRCIVNFHHYLSYYTILHFSSYGGTSAFISARASASDFRTLKLVLRLGELSFLLIVREMQGSSDQGMGVPTIELLSLFLVI